jgi:hypothetical protein
VLSSCCPASARGTYASSRTWGGMRWTQAVSLDERRCARTAKSCGPGAPTLALSFRGTQFRGRDGGKRARSPGRSRISRKTIAQGRSDDPATPVVLPRATFYARGPRVRAGTRPSLRPLMISEGGSRSNSGAIRAARMSTFVFSFSPFLREEGRDEGLSPRTELAERAPHPKFAAQISTSPRIRLRPKAGFGGQESGAREFPAPSVFRYPRKNPLLTIIGARLLLSRYEGWPRCGFRARFVCRSLPP